MIKFKQMTFSQKTDIVLRNTIHLFIIFLLPLLPLFVSFYFELNTKIALASTVAILPIYYVFARIAHRKKWYLFTERPYTRQYTFHAEQNLLGSVFFGQVFAVFISLGLAAFLFFSSL